MHAHAHAHTQTHSLSRCLSISAPLTPSPSHSLTPSPSHPLFFSLPPPFLHLSFPLPLPLSLSSLSLSLAPALSLSHFPAAAAAAAAAAAVGEDGDVSELHVVAPRGARAPLLSFRRGRSNSRISRNSRNSRSCCGARVHRRRRPPSSFVLHKCLCVYLGEECLDCVFTQVLVCTDVAARGLDFPGIDWIVQVRPLLIRVR